MLKNTLINRMATVKIAWAPGNRWFASGFNKAITVRLEDVEVQILSLPYFLASKMDAFFDRGIKDLYASHDFEDIVYLFNYSTGLVEQILNAEEDEVKTYLVDSIKKITEDERMMNAMPGHLFFDGVDERMEIILDKMKTIVHGL